MHGAMASRKEEKEIAARKESLIDRLEDMGAKVTETMKQKEITSWDDYVYFLQNWINRLSSEALMTGLLGKPKISFGRGEAEEIESVESEETTPALSEARQEQIIKINKRQMTSIIRALTRELFAARKMAAVGSE